MNFTGIDGVTAETEKLAKRVRSQVTEECLLYYEKRFGLGHDAALRLANLLLIIPIVEVWKSSTKVSDFSGAHLPVPRVGRSGERLSNSQHFS